MTRLWQSRCGFLASGLSLCALHWKRKHPHLMQWAQSVLQAAASQAHLSGLEGDNGPRHLSTYFVFFFKKKLFPIKQSRSRKYM